MSSREATVSSTQLAFHHAGFQGRIGVAQVEITPPVGVYARNWGAAQHDVADSIHRPLKLSVLTLASNDDGQRQILIDADLGWWKTPGTFARFREQLLPQLEVTTAQLLIALSHTHSGPPLMDADSSLPGSALLQQWMEQLLADTVKAVGQASDSEFEGVLEWGVGRCNLATHRDFPDPNSSQARMLCGFNPAGCPDDLLLVGRVWDRSGRQRATLVNYACHPTTLAWENTAISPDYPGAMREMITQATDAPTLFLLGVCGDLAPRYQYVGDTQVADRHGRQLALAALSVLQGMEPAGCELAYTATVESGAPLAVWRHRPHAPSTVLRAWQACVALPLKDWPTAAELEQQRLACTDRALEERLRRKRDIRRGLGDGATFQLPIYAWRLGEAVLIGSCCEPYSLLQRELRSRFPQNILICMNLVNGSIGYLPPADLYDTDVYPVWQTPFERGGLERVLAAMTEAVQHVLSE